MSIYFWIERSNSFAAFCENSNICNVLWMHIGIILWSLVCIECSTYVRSQDDHLEILGGETIASGEKKLRRFGYCER